MKKIRLLLIALAIISIETSFAGGIVTNTNQSAAWVRMMCRDAVIGIDGVYYNPAGLAFLEDGFYFSLNNQSLFQQKTVTSDYSYLLHGDEDLGGDEYSGAVSAPLFPGIYAGFKTGNLAISLGINPIGGGGSATFDEGLPSFEYGPSELLPKVSLLNTMVGQPAGVDFLISDYSMEAYFEGSSVFWGIQLGASYKINDMISVFLGIRYIYGVNTYNGYLRNISVTHVSGAMRADSLFNQIIIPTISGTINNLNGIRSIDDQLAPAIGLGFGGFYLSDLVTGGLMSQDDANSITMGVLYLGYDASLLTLQQISDLIGAAEPELAGKVTLLEDTRDDSERSSDELLKDQEVDVKQVGTGFTPIIGVNLNFNDKLNIAIKYEMKTTLELENETTKDIVTGFDQDGNKVYMFPDGSKVHNDLPAMLTVGVGYKIINEIRLQSGFHYYWDKSANYGRTRLVQLGYAEKEAVPNDEIIKSGSMEWALGFEFDISDKILLSFGYLGTRTGVKPEYQTDLSYSNSSLSFGLGGRFQLNEMIGINIGMAYTSYGDQEKTFDRLDPTDATKTATLAVKETYGKTNMFMALGLDFKF